MKLYSWNVNGIRAAQRKGFLDWFGATQPDVLTVQETKAWPEQLDPELRQPEGYHTWWVHAERKGYSGVGLFSKTEPLDIKLGLGIEKFDSEGRTIIADYGDFTLMTTYLAQWRARSQTRPLQNGVQRSLPRLRQWAARGGQVGGHDRRYQYRA